MGSNRKILIISAVSGSGHKVTAHALKSILKNDHAVDVTPVHRILGIFDYIGELFYNFCLMHRRIRLIAPYHRISKSLIRLYRPVLLKAIKHHLRKNKYACIVSCIPWVNHYFVKAVPHIPLVTVITDFCDSSTHPWIQHKNQRLICPTAKSVEQARTFGLPDKNIYPVSGNIISPRFYANENTIRDKRAELERLALDPERKTVLVFYGGFGPNYMEKLINAVSGWNVIVIWGENPKRVKKSLCVNVGFTRDIPYYMRVSDILVGKPGPGVIAEAVHCDLPVFVDAGRQSLLPQEEDVLEWIMDSGIGGCFRSLIDFKQKMSLIDEQDIARWKGNAGKIANNALFEAAGVIESIVDRI